MTDNYILDTIYTKFKTNIYYGPKLKDFCLKHFSYNKRDCYIMIDNFIKAQSTAKVLILYGLQNTGKATLLFQSILSLSEQDFLKAVYIKASPTTTLGDLNHDLRILEEEGIKYIYIDEITLLGDFIDGAALLSDMYAPGGMKFILSGTDSLGFWLSSHEQLYDRNIMIHTTYIPFQEHSRLLGINDIDEYIEYGGTLKAGSWDFDNPLLNVKEATFRDDESTRFYIDTAISQNIQNSLAHYKGGTHFRHLIDLYRKNLLTGAINRIVENMSHDFLVSVLEDDFKSNDLHMANTNLRHAKELDKFELLDNIDEKSVTKNIMRLLKIRNKQDMDIEFTSAHAYEIKEYLEALDLVYNISIKTMSPDVDDIQYPIITQSGMRYCQAKVLIDSLLHDKIFYELGIKEKNIITQRILNDVKGRMLEDIVLLDTQFKNKDKEVFKLKFSVGEYDMVIFDRVNEECQIFEIKHSDKIVTNQTRHLIDDEKLKQTTKHYGKITRRCVLYRGQNTIDSNGIEYKNVNEYLCGK